MTPGISRQPYSESTAMSALFDETWDEEEVASFLKREGIPDEFADTFKGKRLATSWIFRYLLLRYWPLGGSAAIGARMCAVTLAFLIFC